MPTNRTLLHLHVEAVWNVRLPPLVKNDITLLPESLMPPWKLYAAEMTDGASIQIWRPNVVRSEREALLVRANEALALPPTIITASNIRREVALSQTVTPVMDGAAAQMLARPLTAQDVSLVERFQTDSVDYYFHADRRPLIGVIVDGRLLSLAHSSRRTTEACELGIDTLPEARRRGYALAATLLWASMVAQEGLVPLYSAFAENTASLRLAAAAGYRAFARGVTITG